MTGALEDRELEALFAEARADGRIAAPEPGDGFMARLLADAEAGQAGFAAPTEAMRGAEPGAFAGIWEALRGAFSGWAPMGGLVTAALAGVWIGFVGVEQVSGLNALYGGATETLGTVNLLPEGDTFAFADEGTF